MKTRTQQPPSSGTQPLRQQQLTSPVDHEKSMPKVHQLLHEKISQAINRLHEEGITGPPHTGYSFYFWFRDLLFMVACFLVHVQYVKPWLLQHLGATWGGILVV